LVGIGTVGLGVDLSSKDSAYIKRAAKAADKYSDEAHRQISRCRALPAARAEPCVQTAYNAAEQQYREEYNLAAQETAAWWTKITGLAAICAGVVVSGIGTFLLLLTFWQTRKTSRAELRGYVFPETITLNDGTNEDFRGTPFERVPSVHIVIKNFGKTPARNVKHVSTLVLWSNNGGEPPVCPKMHSAGGATLPPGHTQFTQHVLAATAFNDDERFCLTPLGVEAVKSGSYVFLAYGTIEYEDAFGEPRHTHYRMFHTNHWPLIGGTGGMRFAGRGNSDT
jgi:hypothetical protein